MSPHYPFPFHEAIGILRDTLGLSPRSFSQDARNWVGRLDPPLQVLGEAHLPARGPFLVTVNHFSADGFRAWWIPMAISAVLNQEVHWIMTAAWTFDRKRWARPAVPLTRWLLRRLAQVYGFTSMPPMPPDPAEVGARAGAVRQALSYAHRAPQPVIGLSPEGGDAPAGRLSRPPAGVGRFISLLLPYCRVILPAGVYETPQGLGVNFGRPYRLALPSGLGPDERDAQVSQAVMTAIARLLPSRLQGEFVAGAADQTGLNWEQDGL